MADHPLDTFGDADQGVRALLARAAAAEMRARDRLELATRDFLLPVEARLDERTRTALTELVAALVATVEGEIREHAARQLEARDEGLLAAALEQGGSVLQRLHQTGWLGDPELMAELLGRVGQDLLAQSLPMHGSLDTDRPSLINRLVQHADRVVASSALSVLVAESERRNLPEGGVLARTDLPAELHHRLVWWVAAALRESLADQQPLDPFDRALCDAAQRSLMAHDEADRPEAAAMRLAMAIDAPREGLPALLIEALGDRRVGLFIALIAHALGIGYATVRGIVLAPQSDQLWVAFRALGLSRETIAHLGYALSEADARRDLETFADQLDAIAAVTPEVAQAVLAPLRLPNEYRAALHALEQGSARPWA